MAILELSQAIEQTIRITHMRVEKMLWMTVQSTISVGVQPGTMVDGVFVPIGDIQERMLTGDLALAVAGKTANGGERLAEFNLRAVAELLQSQYGQTITVLSV